jgi:hypothetical protein
MADDVLVIKYDCYEAGRLAPDIIEKTVDKKTKEEKDKVVGWEGKLIPKSLVECAFFSEERADIDELKNKIYSGEIEDSKTIAAILAYVDKYVK